ncbi:MAG TPA: hypothetical protein VHM19_01845, partial [Polyangiales bacterium]|nr:hypothetical protein [Polyangiales bacterium]
MIRRKNAPGRGLASPLDAWSACVLGVLLVLAVLAQALPEHASAQAQDASVTPHAATPLVPANPAVLDASVDPLEALRSRVTADDADGALALLATLPPELSTRVDLRYLTARMQERRGKIKEALAALPEPAVLAALPAPVVQDALTRRALWLARTGDCAQARPQLVTVLASAPTVELTMAAAQCALGESDVASALALLHGV